MQLKHGVVHRDLKPQNIFLHNEGGERMVKIGDYGMAKAFDAAGLSGHTMTGALAGTPVFMCRQQVIDFKFAKPEVDVWAAAATLYFVLTGKFPRDFQTGQDVWQTVLSQPTTPIRKRRLTIPRKLANVVDAALDDRRSLEFKNAMGPQTSTRESDLRFRCSSYEIFNIGRERVENQDRWFADDHDAIYIVADGIESSLAGGLAAQIWCPR